MFHQIEIDYLPKNKIDYLVNKSSSIRYKCIILLMCDAGLRVTETISLQLGHFDFRDRTLTVSSLKKKEKARFKHRMIPITDRLYSALLSYIPSLKDPTDNSFLFPSPTNSNKPIVRESVNKYLTRFKKNHSGFEQLHPHALRHSYATYLLSNGQSLDTLQRLLGHEDKNITAIYAHIPTEELKAMHAKVFDPDKSKIQKIKDKIFGVKSEPLINISPLQNELMIGRDLQVMEINDKLNRNINMILLGGVGVGKSTILKNINIGTRKSLYIDDTSEMKTTLLNTLLYLHETKEKVFELIYGEYDKQALKTKLSRHTMKNLAKAICEVVQPQEYVLVIDTVDRIPPRVVDVFETFKDHFTIITTAREIPLNKTSFLWNFETLKIEPLERSHSLDLISKLSNNMEVEDFEQYRNYIWNKSDGNPRVIFEMIDRFRKEPVISKDVVRSIDHYGSLKEYDMSLFILIGLGFMAIFRYYGRETGDTSFTFLGGVAMILLILSRYFFGFTKHRVLK
jgi:hypothetical protein